MTAIRICPDMDIVCPFQAECDATRCLKLYASPSDWKPKPNGPVRTVTRKEIVRGTYGPANGLSISGYIGSPWDNIGIVSSTYDAADLREFARLLTEIADAMEEKP